VTAQCVDCHNLANGSTGALSHFTSLATPQMEGAASGTVVLTGGTYTAATQACTVTCHSKVHSNLLWTGGANHPVPYLASAHTAVNQAGFNANCATCHAATGSVSPMSAAPTCTTCHQGGSPLTVINCASCHAKPPTGTAFPNVAGTHAVHNTLAGVTGLCSACHTGSETGTQTHYDHANNRPGLNSLRVAPGQVGFPATTYNAKTGAATFNATALTCSNVSCHGGQTTPVWGSGTLNVNTQCTSCHVRGTTQYNSPNSGEHGLSNHSSKACTVCHNITTLATSHFAGLSTTIMDLVAARASIGGGSTNVTSYNATSGSCSPTCHGAKNW
jgi:predicted CxxxxCH...CXXCH cytochrome family protein